MSDRMPDQLRMAINQAYRMDETTCIQQLIDFIDISPNLSNAIERDAIALINAIRKQKTTDVSIENFLHIYQLNSEEGIALMCLAEALLRVPDQHNIDALINDKLTQLAQSEQAQSAQFFVNATSLALMLTGKVVAWHDLDVNNLPNALRRLLQRSGAPIIRQSVKQAMKILGRQFIMGDTIESALKRAQQTPNYCYSYDMLGEAACTAADANYYFDAYLHAINTIGKEATHDPITAAGVSVKLSALHPRYEAMQCERVLPILAEKVTALALAAKQHNIGLTIDAEEADRLDFSLDIVQHVFCKSALADWDGFGVAVQAYQKRAWYVIDWLAALARQQRRRLMVRLIKGAYWDTEIKQSQANGYQHYPVFTRKVSTDVSYLACAKKLLDYGDVFYPQFATHNAYSVAAILNLIGDRRDIEFQCLYGMGNALYDQIVNHDTYQLPCRIYAPVGSHQALLPYLVRRLLENGANTSFVSHIIDESIPLSTLTADPIQQLSQLIDIPHPHIPLPRDLYSAERKNSPGIDLSDRQVVQDLQHVLHTYQQHTIAAKPLIAAKSTATQSIVITAPYDQSHQVGTCVNATDNDIDNALTAAVNAASAWQQTPVKQRAHCLFNMADLLEANRDQLLHLLINEAGKTIVDAINEWREAIDFCRYYANQAVNLCEQPTVLTGTTGEYNQLCLHGRGVIVCISPWNFPLAIFLGQVAAALVTGNTVLAKPAEQTSLIAYIATQLCHQAGITTDVLQLLPGDGETVGARLVSDPRINGVMFTGSTQTAQHINQTLANRQGAIIPFIAETGGQNVMLVDSTALLQQVVNDVIQSAFYSAGQRCSALRVLYLQQEMADNIIELLQGAMAELVIGDPNVFTTDIGPVINHDALTLLRTHQAELTQQAKLIYQVSLSEKLTKQGTFFAPCAFEINDLSQLPTEIFGPCLHIIRYDISRLDDVLTDIQQMGYGLTMGIHSRIESRVQAICDKMHIGNIYVNRNMVGAVVGVQPFGGEGLSGTGPKAGGPHYLTRLCCERTISIDTTATGGNASLIMLDDE